jgi:hypothetical protein
MEKIISEFKVIETDDGFRIDIKGDKDALRKMFIAGGPHRVFRGRGRRGHQVPFGPGFGGGFHGWCGPWDEPEQEEVA